MNAFVSFDLFMVYIPECKQQKYEIIYTDTRYCTLGCSFIQGRIQDFKLGGGGGGGAHLKKLLRTEGGAKFLLVFRVKNHDFTPKNHIFSNFRGGGGGGAPGAPPPGSAPVIILRELWNNQRPRCGIAWLHVINHLYHGFPS